LKTPVVEVEGAEKRFGEIHAVDGVDLVVHEGEVLGLIGHNGAGKSTLFRLMLGLLPPDHGRIHLLGEPVRGPRFREVRHGLGYLPENVVFYDNLSGAETLRFFADLKGADPRQCGALLERVGLTGSARRPVRGYSKGMRQRLGFAQALLGKPRLLLLDEPTNGLDPRGIREFYAMLAELKREGVTVLLSSHNLAEIEERVDRLALMRLGRLQATGSVQALREELELPVRIRVAVTPGTAERACARLISVVGDRVGCNGAEVLVQCERGSKMAVLAALADCGEIVTDVQIREPSLEDVFLGYAEN
jgi:Cu-processing system ATP-binding protein